MLLTGRWGEISVFANALANKGYYTIDLWKTTSNNYLDLHGFNVFIRGGANIPYKASEHATDDPIST
ncbi:hypothetical protein ACFVSW_10205 [Neobacillus sp. NPDC058068]|uniref:hypothetical protein n=1 Tax=Neobacillus sp. NPDC058068 TaxID=3346325 RepID=UPI0036D79010